MYAYKHNNALKSPISTNFKKIMLKLFVLSIGVVWKGNHFALCIETNPLK
jgi:hypothetical protein